MARVKLNIPGSFPFSLEIGVRITDANYGGHLGNDKVLALVQEARVSLLQHLGFTELDVAGVGTIMTDAIVVYKSEAFPGDILRIGVALADIGKFGCDFLYKLENKETNREVARAKTGIVFFDYKLRKMAPTPELFMQRCAGYRVQEDNQ